MTKNKTDKKIKMTDVEEIKLKSDKIAGLSSVIVVFLDFTEEDELLKGAVECLMDEAFRLQEKCNLLLEKLCQ